MNQQTKTASKTKLTRRELLRAASATAAFTIVAPHVLGGAAGPAPSEKANIGSIGVGGMQGFNDVRNVGRSENIYAMCDVDEANLKKAAQQFPQAKLYRDFR